MPILRKSALHSATSFLPSRSSSIVVMSGNIILMSPNALARKMALICDLKSSRFLRQYLIARNPMNGFSSFSSPRYGMSLSPPISSVLIISDLPFKIRAAFLYASYCSSSVGIEVLSMNRNSVLKSPTPSPSASTALTASSGFPMLQKSS